MAVLLVALTALIIYKYGPTWFIDPESLIELPDNSWGTGDVIEYKGYWVPKSCLTAGNELVERSIYATWVLHTVDMSVTDWAKNMENKAGVKESVVLSGENCEYGYYKSYELINERILPRVTMYIGKGGSGVVIDNDCVWFYTVDLENKMWNEVNGILVKNGIDLNVEEIMGVSEVNIADSTFVGVNQYNTGYTDDTYFDIDAESGFITKYHGQYKYAPEFVIIAPMLNGVEVKGIAPDAFYKYHNVNKLKAIVLPDSLKYLGDGAFKACDMLEKVYISDDIRYIGVECFAGCGHLTEIRLPSTIVEIGAGAFKGCTELKRVEVPEGAVIGENAFEPTTEIVIIKNKDNV